MAETEFPVEFTISIFANLSRQAARFGLKSATLPGGKRYRQIENIIEHSSEEFE